MSARQVAEALNKNYNTTRSLLRKMEATGEIRHVDNQYFPNVGADSHMH